MCQWDDQTAGAAFAATIDAWYDAGWDEYASRELNVIGESYVREELSFWVGVDGSARTMALLFGEREISFRGK